MRPTGIEVSCKCSAHKGLVSCPNTVPAAILAVGGWSRLLGVCRALKDRAESCRTSRDIFMRIRPFSQPRHIKTGCLISIGDQRERVPPCVSTTGHPRVLDVLSRSMGKVLMQ